MTDDEQSEGQERSILKGDIHDDSTDFDAAAASPAVPV